MITLGAKTLPVPAGWGLAAFPPRALWLISSLAVLAIFSAPIINIALWHAIDQRLPSDDAGDLATIAVLAYEKIQDLGLWRGFHDAIMLREPARAYVTAQLAVPFIAATGGNFLVALPATLIFFLSVIWAYTYGTLRLYDVSSICGAVCATFIATFPWVVLMSQVFMAELGMIAGLAGALYHAHRMKLWQHRGHSIAFGLLVALTLCARLWEILPAALFAIFGLMVAAKHAGIIRRRDFVATIAATVVITCILLLRVLRRLDDTSGMIAVAIAAFSYVSVCRVHALALNRNHSLSVAAFALIFGLWWVPGIESSYYAMTTILFDPFVAQNYPGRYLSGLGDVVRFFIEASGAMHLAVAFALSSLAASMVLFERNSHTRRGLVAIVIVGCIFVSLPIVATAISNVGDPRRAYSGVYLLAVGMTGLATTSEIRLYQFRAGVLAIVTFVVMFRLLSVTLSSENPAITAAVARPSWATFEIPPARSPLFDRQVLDAVEHNVPNGSSVGVLSVATSYYPARIFDRASLKLLAAGDRSRISFAVPTDYSSMDDGYTKLNRYRFFLVDTYSDEGVNERNPMTRLAHDLASSLLSGRVPREGLRIVATFFMGGRELFLLENTSGESGESTPIWQVIDWPGDWSSNARR